MKLKSFKNNGFMIIIGCLVPVALFYPLQHDGEILKAQLFLDAGGKMTRIASIQGAMTMLKEPATIPKEASIMLPRRLTNPNTTQALIDLGGGPHFLTVLSGCRMARWVLPWLHNDSSPKIPRDDCKMITEPEKQLVSVQQLESNDTIYVTHVLLARFVDWLWDSSLAVDIVVITGQWQLSAPHDPTTIDRLLQHPHVIMWFCQNLPMFVGGGQDQQQSSNHSHKLAPFPYGLREEVGFKSVKSDKSLIQYRKVFLKGPTKKWDTVMTPRGQKQQQPRVYAGYLRSIPDRKNIPNGRSLTPYKFYQMIQESHYILSPNGDRPECYRHYEALGLGTVPLTQLDPVSFRHFEGSGLVFNNTVWRVERLMETLDPHPIVNRNLVLEEYWMEYVDWTTDRALNWWSVEQHQPTTVNDLLSKLTMLG